MSEQLYEHKVGHGLLHRARHTHQAQPITSGERHNLIVWMRSSSVRNRECPMCGRLPSLVDSPGYGDGFTRTVCKEDCAEQKPCYVL